MKTVALVSLCVAMAAAVAGVVMILRQLRRAARSEKWQIAILVACIAFVVIGIANIALLLTVQW